MAENLMNLETRKKSKNSSFDPLVRDFRDGTIWRKTLTSWSLALGQDLPGPR
jgi:hypothetical protein